MASFEMTAGDLYPPLPGLLSDSNGPLDLTNATSVAVTAKGSKSTLTGTCTILQVAFTADTTQSSAQLTNVSAFTNIWGPGTEPWETGSPIYGSGIPAPSGSVGAWSMPTVMSFDTVGKTITMSQQATATATGVSLIANLGYVQYTWVSGDTSSSDSYTGYHTVTWPGSKPQTFPSVLGNRWTLKID